MTRLLSDAGTPQEIAAEQGVDDWRALRPVWREVDLDAISHNLGRLRQWTRPEVAVVASLKGDAYGHGALAIGAELDRQGVPLVMTDIFADAKLMRQRGHRFDVVLLGGPLPEALPACLRADIVPTIHSMADAEALSQRASSPARAFVKVDSGLGRFGVPVEVAARSIQRIARLPNVVVDGIYTHLPFSDQPGEQWAAERLAHFVGAVEEIRRAGVEPRMVQAMSSPGVLAGLDHPALTAVCIGSLLYGLPAHVAPTRDVGELRGALAAIRARLVAVNHHRQARRAGSGGIRAHAAGDVTGVIPIGLADGYGPVIGGGDLEVLVGGCRVPVVAITMAHTILDLSALASVHVGQEVTIMGSDGAEEIGPEELAAKLGLTVAALTLRFNRRVPYDHLRLGARTRAARSDAVAY